MTLNASAQPVACAQDMADLAGHVARVAAATPHAIAVAGDGGNPVTYQELLQRSEAVRAALSRHGCAPGDVVAVAVPRGADAIAAILAVLAGGMTYCPLDPDYPRAWLADRLADVRPRLALTEATDSLGAHATPTLPLAVAARGPASTAGPPARVDPSAPAYLMHTSGSSGEPKGVLVPRRAIGARVLWELETYPLRPDDSVLHHTSLSFDISLWEILVPLAAGARVVVADNARRRDPERLLRLMAAEAVTTIGLVPSLLRLLLDEDEGLRACPRLRDVFCGGERLDRSLHDRFLATSHARLHNMYGPTEYAIDATHWDCRPLPPGEEVPIGRPLTGARLYVLDEGLRPVQTGAPGELCVAGPQLALGYWGQPELTARAFPPDPFMPGEHMYRTGDVVCQRPDGALRFVGRRDGQVKIRGHRVELEEVRARLGELPGVRAAAARVFSDAQESVLIGYVVLDANAPTPAALRASLADRVAPHLVPAQILPLDRLPLGPTGKLDLAALPTPAAHAGDGADAASPAAEVTSGDGATTSACQAVREIFQQVLRRADVGPDDDFFELGGNSLQAARLVNRLRKRFDAPVALTLLFQASTPAALAAAVGKDVDHD